MSAPENSPLSDALEKGLANHRLRDELNDLGDITVESAAEAVAICRALDLVVHGEESRRTESVYALAGLFQDVPDTECEAFEILRDDGIPLLLAFYEIAARSDDSESENCAMFILKILALYATPAGTEKVIQEARRGYNPDGYLWSVILGCYTHDHPGATAVFDALSDPLPAEFIGISLLDAANQAAIGGLDFQHPFNNADGKLALRKWLRGPDPEKFSYAHSATAALPFIAEPERTDLLQLAMDHPDTGVSIEAAWAAARVGQERGIVHLARYAKDFRTSAIACRYLEELEREDAIPEETLVPEFQAMAELASWLAHPNEFGEPPDAMELVDSRDLYWPPTEDRRQLWLFKYRYAPGEHRENEDIGIGLVGSVTFSLFGEVTANLEPLDAYALHCCWELEMNSDPRAPARRTIEAGRALLAQFNKL